MYQDGGKHPWLTLQRWALFVGLVLFAAFLAHDLDVLSPLIVRDSTRISVLILLLGVLALLHGGWRGYVLGREREVLAAWHRSQTLPFEQNSAICRYLQRQQARRSVLQQAESTLVTNDADSDSVPSELLAERLRGAHASGWFLSGLVIKLGLLGTVIGFVMMLDSISGLEQLDLSAVKSLMQQMTAGMGVAMTTTMVGLLVSMVIALQYLLLDRAADHLLADALEAA